MRAGFAENGEVGLEIKPWLPFQTTWTFLVNQCWLWNSIILVYNHTNMCFGPEQPQNEFIFLQNWDLLEIKCWGWSRNSSMIIILGFMNLNSKLILNSNWYSISLQPCTHVYWVRTATKLVHLPPKWGLTFQKMVRLDWKIVHDSHVRPHEPS